jgi:hypothetical protein
MVHKPTSLHSPLLGSDAKIPWHRIPSRYRKMVKQSRISRNEELFGPASRYKDQRNVRSAIRLYLIAAKNGDAGSQLNLGNLVRRGSPRARKPRRCHLLVQTGMPKRARQRCKQSGSIVAERQGSETSSQVVSKSAQMGNEEVHLEIAGHYLRNDADVPKAIVHLEKSPIRASSQKQAQREGR